MRPDEVKAAATAGVPVVYLALATLRAPVEVLTLWGVALLGAPGYVWCEVILARAVRGLERAAVVVGLTLAIPVVIGLILYEGGVPLDRRTWAITLGCLVLVGDVVLLVLRRPSQSDRLGLPMRLSPYTGRLVAFAIAVVCGVAAVGVARLGAAKQHYPGFTELWLVPRRDNALQADVGVTNHQGSVVHYQLVLIRAGRVAASWKMALSDGQTWQRSIPASKFSVGAELYRLPDLAKPYRHVTLSVGGARGS